MVILGLGSRNKQVALFSTTRDIVKQEQKTVPFRASPNRQEADRRTEVRIRSVLWL